MPIIGKMFNKMDEMYYKGELVFNKKKVFCLIETVVNSFFC